MTSPEERAIELLLEEQLGGAEPPDVTASVLAEVERRSRQGTNGWRRFVWPFSRTAWDRREEAGHWASEVWAWVAVSVLLAVALIGFALLVGSTGAAPFIYTMF